MATNGYSPIQFMDTNEKGFYFTVAEKAPGGSLYHYNNSNTAHGTIQVGHLQIVPNSLDQDADFEEDGYTDSQRCLIHKLQSNEDKMLLLNDDGNFLAKQLSIQEQNELECKFNIHIYERDSTVTWQGKAVMLYVKKDDKKIVVFCSGENEIHPKEMTIPQKIEEAAHNALFCMKQLIDSDKLMFESTKYPCKFLGFEPTKEDSTLHQLVLRQRGKDEPDDACEILLM